MGTTRQEAALRRTGSIASHLTALRRSPTSSSSASSSKSPNTAILLEPVGSPEAWEAMVGTELGYSEWRTLDQSRVDAFAECTEDHQVSSSRGYVAHLTHFTPHASHLVSSPHHLNTLTTSRCCSRPQLVHTVTPHLTTPRLTPHAPSLSFTHLTLPYLNTSHLIPLTGTPL